MHSMHWHTHTHALLLNCGLSDGAACKCFAINSTWWRMTETFDAAQLLSGVPAESYFHRMLCMHFSDRLLQETGAQEGGGNTTGMKHQPYSLLSEANCREGHKNSCIHLTFWQKKNNLQSIFPNLYASR